VVRGLAGSAGTVVSAMAMSVGRKMRFAGRVAATADAEDGGKNECQSTNPG